VTVRFLQGDCRDVLKTLPDQSVHCVVTSPPYWGLRDYGVDGQIGLESSLEEFLSTMIEVFREVRRVLRDDGTCWVNLGDSYNGQGARSPNIRDDGSLSFRAGGRAISVGTLKPKDLCGVPWRVAFALQADGWYLRQDIIWAKPNPMPESIYDRCTKAHEYIFLLSKSARYFYDAAAISETASDNTHARTGKIKMPDNWATGPGAHGAFLPHGRNEGKTIVRAPGVTPKSAPEGSLIKAKESWHASTTEVLGTRNKRSVWTVSTAPFAEAHFATFPPALIEPCIKAGTSEGGCCAKCAAPFSRIIERGEPDRAHQIACGGDPETGGYEGKATKDYAAGGAQDASATKARILAGMVEKKTIGFEPTCRCDAGPPIPCTVLDPFGGAGTTGLVSDRLQRSAILIELNPEYLAIAKRRIHGDAPLFSAVEESSAGFQRAEASCP
jgi:DNA modification methylase